MTSEYILPLQPAGSDLLAIEMYSDQDKNEGLGSILAPKLCKKLFGQRILIIGGRCGLTAEIMLPSSTHIDIVEEEPYFNLLNTRFIQNRDVVYQFGKEGMLGDKVMLPKPNNKGTKINIINAKDFDGTKTQFYDVVILERIIFNEKINIVKQLLKTKHSILYTLISQGKISNDSTKNLWKQTKKYLGINYQKIQQQRIKSIRHITGRRNEMIFFDYVCLKSKNENNIQMPECVFEQTLAIQGNLYETQALVDMYIEFHYGKTEYFGVKNYPQVCAELCISIAKKHEIRGRALDMGCAIGKSTVQLAQHFDEAIGIDFSKAFIDGADKCLMQYHQNKVGKVKFFVGDACNMDPKLGNLIDRLQEPEAFLNHVNEFLEPKGILILSSPYSWLQEYTPIQKWIGGYMKNNEAVTTQQGLRNILIPKGFTEIKEEQNVRFVIKENDWVYQFTLANITFWMKN